MPNANNFTSEQAFSKWKGYLLTVQDERYVRRERRVHLAMLAETMQLCGISYEDAVAFRYRAMMEITTDEGRKGKGKHKGWKENCLEDFDALMANQYVNLETLIGNGGDMTRISPFTPDSDIKAWVDKKFNGNSEILKQAHVIGNMYNLMFLDYLNEEVSNGHS